MADWIPLQVMEDAAECLKTLAHPHRLRMVEMLLAGEFTVGELADACEIPSHMASEHLRLLKDRGLLASNRDGRKIYYKVAQPHLASILDCIRDHFASDGPDAKNKAKTSARAGKLARRKT